MHHEAAKLSSTRPNRTRCAQLAFASTCVVDLDSRFERLHTVEKVLRWEVRWAAGPT